MRKKLQPLFNKVGIDGAIAFTMLSRVIQAGGGVISLIFIARFLNGAEQGFYYTFNSIIALQVFFELGLSSIITQYTAHEFAHLKWTEAGTLEGSIYHQSRLSSLLRFCLKWFGVLSVALFFILIIVGIYFFTNYNKGANINWYGPWIALCAATALNLFIDPILAFYEGLGDVKDVAKLRLIQKTLFILCLFVFFAAGFKLYAAPLASIVAIGVNYVQLNFNHRLTSLKAIWRTISQEKVNYVKEIFPLQWRIALSWVSAYFIFQLFTPVLFATQGATAAGQMGMTLQALTGVSTLAMSWISTKVPLLSSHVARKEYAALDSVFNKTLKQLMAVSIISLVAFAAFIYLMNYLKLPLSKRFIGIMPIALLCITTFLNQVIFSWAIYLRSHKQEPFLVNTVCIGVLCAFSTFINGNLWGLHGIVIGYCAIIMLISTPWAYYIFQSKKKLWHG